jgi:hypothetical protein
MAAPKHMQLIKATHRTNRLSRKTFFALHMRSPFRAAFASNKNQFRRRISLKEFGMLRSRRIVAYFVLIESFVRARALRAKACQSASAAAVLIG